MPLNASKVHSNLKIKHFSQKRFSRALKTLEKVSYLPLKYT
jgi:hypothetical protein